MVTLPRGLSKISVIFGNGIIPVLESNFHQSQTSTD
jgi:hypothetical protein